MEVYVVLNKEKTFEQNCISGIFSSLETLADFFGLYEEQTFFNLTIQEINKYVKDTKYIIHVKTI